MQLEKIIDGITVVIEGTAFSTLVSIGSYDYESEYESKWLEEPEIIDAYDSEFEPVFLMPSQRKEIIEGLDINDFII